MDSRPKIRGLEKTEQVVAGDHVLHGVAQALAQDVDSRPKIEEDRHSRDVNVGIGQLHTEYEPMPDISASRCGVKPTDQRTVVGVVP